jgi:hypothetical protein
MSVALDPVLRVGGVAVAALVECSVNCGRAPAIWFFGTKSPVAILVRRDGATSAFETDGTGIAPDDLERRFPGQRAAFERAADGAERASPRT